MPSFPQSMMSVCAHTAFGDGWVVFLATDQFIFWFAQVDFPKNHHALLTTSVGVFNEPNDNSCPSQIFTPQSETKGILEGVLEIGCDAGGFTKQHHVCA